LRSLKPAWALAGIKRQQKGEEKQQFQSAIH
jgi:hypothetical protein